MQNINIDDGFKEFMINNDPERVIRFNPADIGIMERAGNAIKNIDSYKFDQDIELGPDGEPADKFEAGVSVLKEFRKYINDQIDYIFGSPISSVVFGNQSPLSMIGGIPLYERVLDAIIPIVKAEIIKQQKESRKRIDKYAKQVK